MPPHRLLTPSRDRHFNEVNPGDRDTLVVSWHPDVLHALVSHQYEMAVLLALALTEHQAPFPSNPMLCMLLSPLGFLAEEEVAEASERLTVRGFVERADKRSPVVNREAICLVAWRDLPAAFRLQWNAAKATVPAPVPFGE
ncbi:hypothetical protein ACFYNX_26785 [Streptomyces sp. NPDC007872]|uniref:hypothetical protein n=1 Tax=Streptomyces sp. NPDC007872 TaxID=3364782 RepID=UPI00368CD2D5